MAIWVKKLKNKKLYKFFAPQVHLIDIKNLFKDKSLEGAMRELGETARVYKGQPDLEKEGYYIAEDDGLDNAEDNNVVGVLKEYFNNSFSNPNLLINGDFSIWQRGDIFNNVKDRVYTADRWRMIYNYNKIVPDTIQSSNVGMKITGKKGVRTLFGQMLELNDIENIYNLPLTISIEYEILRGNPKVVAFIRTDSAQYNFSEKIDRVDSEVVKSTKRNGRIVSTLPVLPLGSQTLIACFRIDNDASTSEDSFEVVIKNVKLEIGDKATPFIPRSYGEELALCQRYYQSINTLHSNGYMLNNANIVKDVIFPTTMRTIPTVNVVAEGSSVSGVDKTTASAMETNNSKTTLYIRKDASDGYYNVYWNLTLDAEIY